MVTWLVATVLALWPDAASCARGDHLQFTVTASEVSVPPEFSVDILHESTPLESRHKALTFGSKVKHHMGRVRYPMWGQLNCT